MITKESNQKHQRRTFNFKGHHDLQYSCDPQASTSDPPTKFQPAKESNPVECKLQSFRTTLKRYKIEEKNAETQRGRERTWCDLEGERERGGLGNYLQDIQKEEDSAVASQNRRKVLEKIGLHETVKQIKLKKPKLHGSRSTRVQRAVGRYK